MTWAQTPQAATYPPIPEPDALTLRGECGPRQTPDAKVSVWANAVGPFSGAMLMTSD